jgi:NACHT domain
MWRMGNSQMGRFPRKLRRAVVGLHNTRRLLVGAVLFIAIGVITNLLTPLLTPALLAGQQSWWFRLVMFAVAIIVALVYLHWESRSGSGSPDAIEAQLSQLRSMLRSQVKDRSYGARSILIEDRLPTLALAITPRVGWVRDPTGTEPKPISERTTDIVAAFKSSRGRLLIVGEPGSGKTMAAYSLIEHLNENRGNERKPLLVNLSAWQDQDDFEAFLVDYLCSSVGYEVRERSVANAFISSCKYTLILDGLDEIPSELRTHFPERLYEFARKAPLSDVGVVVTCRTREYEQLLDARPTGLGLVQAVDILPLTSKQLDSAFRELAKFDEDWGAFLSQRDLAASQRARGVLSIPLFLNLAVVGQVSPCQLLKCVNTRELRALVLERYLARTLAEGQRQYASADARRYLTWIARFLKGTEVSPFGLETSDSTVFDLANLTPPEPPSRYRLDSELVSGLVSGLGLGLVLRWPFVVLVLGLVYWLFLVRLRPFYSPEYAAVSTQINLTWPLTRQQRRFFLRELLSPLFLGMFLGLIWGLVWGPFFGALVWGRSSGWASGSSRGQAKSCSDLSMCRIPLAPPKRRDHARSPLRWSRGWSVGYSGGRSRGCSWGCQACGCSCGDRPWGWAWGWSGG